MEQFGTRQAFSVQVKRHKYLKKETLNIMITIINNFIQSFFHSHILKKIYSWQEFFSKNTSKGICQNVSFSEETCGDPPEIPNAISVSDGYSNGSITLYSCLTEFLANSESPIIMCNGRHWSSSTFQCLGNFNASCTLKDLKTALSCVMC